MSTAEFFDWQTGGGGGDLHRLAAAWRAAGIRWCVIGGLAVNHWAREPIVTRDADLVVASAQLEQALEAAEEAGFKMSRFPLSVNLKGAGELDIQVTVDERYREMADRSAEADVCGMTLPVASLEDTFQGKLWAWSDPARRPLKRRKDELDLLRLAEAHPQLSVLLPPAIRL
jgi:Nucleotidyl transferase AbiEii toxin, Type IV TA system